MGSASDVCILDYLVGTLSTAYKGVITSLAARDFCISEEGKAAILKGSVLAMPPGNYEASLIQKGVELARTTLDRGTFRLRVPSDQVHQASDLQIDIIQSGRHIGTFLLKKKDATGFFRSAIDLSAEIRDLDFKLLTVPLRNKVGLLAKAEEIITDILSTKKDWPAFSERLNTFRQDFFWAARDAWYEAVPILARFLRKAAESAGGDGGKPVDNFLAFIEDLLENESDRDRLHRAAEIWLAELNASSLDPASRFLRFTAALEALHGLFPPADIGPGLARVLDSIRRALESMPIESPALLGAMRKHTGREGAALEHYGSEAREKLRQSVILAEEGIARGDFDDAFLFLAGLDPAWFDSASLISLFRQAVSERLTRESASDFTEAVLELIRRVPQMPQPAVGVLQSLIPTMIAGLADLGRSDLCGRVIEALARSGSPLNEDMLFSPSIAKAVIRSDSRALAADYTAALTGIMIPSPRVTELSAENWAEVVNPLHLDRLGKFMDLIQIGDACARKLLVHVIANLSLSGVFVPDDRIFQRRISAYLNSPAMAAPFLLHFLFLVNLPVYYHEVGAVSTIRDLSTEIDSWGNDPILYFLRKQVHVNASNYNIRLLEKIISAWVFHDLSLLRDAVPADIYASRKPELVERYSSVITPFLRSRGVLDGAGIHFETLQRLPADAFRSDSGRGQQDEVQSKVVLICRLYREVARKYSLGLGQGGQGKEPAIGESLAAMESAKRTFLQAGTTEAREDLYFKRHIAFGIPSVLGTYHEPKFDALELFLRSGAAVRRQLEQSALALSELGPHAPLEDLLSRLRLLSACRRVLALHGLDNMLLEEFETLIARSPLRLSQVVDVLRMWQKEIGWMVLYFNRTFHEPLVSLLKHWPDRDLPDQFRGLDRKDPDFTNKAADIMIRTLMASVPGLMESDRIIGAMLNLLSIRAGIQDEPIHAFPGGEPAFCFDVGGLADDEVRRIAPVIGGKAKNIAYLQNRGFRVPAAAVLSARFMDPALRERHLAPAIRDAVRLIETRTGTKFGDHDRPLFLAVRSGSYVSMPGILSTILYCGMNSETLRALIRSTGDARHAYDSRRRFIEQYSQTVLGLDAAVLEQIRSGFVRESGQTELEQLRARDLEELVRRYEDVLRSRGLIIPEDVYLQLEAAVECIYASWVSERAEQFRRATKTSPAWGTSAMLMQMVYANASGGGSSVFFTRNPFTLERGVYGETRACSTGDDLVYGSRLNLQLSLGQIHGNRDERASLSLEETDSPLFRLHQDLGMRIEHAMGGLPQEVEAAYVRTREGTPLLFVLQARRMEFQAGRRGRFDEICGMESRIVGRGIGAYGGAVSGVASFARSREQAERLGRKTGMRVILFRNTANTDDVSLMPVIAGIATASGGVTSHAAVLAQKFGVNAVVACSRLFIGTDERGAAFARIGTFEIREGDPISIDGANGLVFSGTCFEISDGRR